MGYSGATRYTVDLGIRDSTYTGSPDQAVPRGMPGKERQWRIFVYGGNESKPSLSSLRFSKG
jgi:hypothetical protein